MSFLTSGGMIGDIWSTGAFSFESSLKELLDSGDYTLEQLLAEDELLQELRGMHRTLIQYMSTEQAVTKLVQYVIQKPASGASSSSDDDGHATNHHYHHHPTTTTKRGASEWLEQQHRKNDADKKMPEKDFEMRHIRFPYMACEIICCEIQSIIDVLVDGYVVVDDDDDAVSPPQPPQLKKEADKNKEEEMAEPKQTAVVKAKDVPEENGDQKPAATTTTTKDNYYDDDHDDASEPNNNNNNNSSSSTKKRMRILDLLFSVLYDTPPGQLDDYRAGYFEKILTVLFRRRPDALTTYINITGCNGTDNTAAENNNNKKKNSEMVNAVVEKINTLQNEKKKELSDRRSIMHAMLQHLYSHSIMQIAQRLLLPPRPTLPPQDDAAAAAAAAEQQQPDDDDENAAVGAEILSEEQGDTMMMLMMAGSGGGGSAVAAATAEAAESEEPSVRCDWPQSQHALALLLESLMHPVVAECVDMSAAEQEERRLNLSLNASEVLITIIQNSMLSSDTMLSLTSSETIRQVVDAATILHCPEGEEEYFSPHESLLTSAMNVLESLILQLGGYGAVGTMFLLPQEGTQQGENDDTGHEEKEGSNEEDEGTSSSSSSGKESQQSQQQQEPKPQKQLIADLTGMLEHLPVLLERLSYLLRHPSTKQWTSPTQYSKTTPQQLLGSSRLRIVRVLESLVLLGDPEIDSHLVQSDCLAICLDLFWEFQWCSMLHQSVANLLVHVFEGHNARIEMQEYFLIKCKLLGRLMDSFTEMQENHPPSIADTSMIMMTNLKEVASSAASERGSSADPLVISEDDVEAALEKQQQEAEQHSGEEKGRAGEELVSTEAVRFESRETSTIGAAAPPPENLRMGYMGHVIIICQALQACSAEVGEDEEQMQLENGEEPDTIASPQSKGDLNDEEPLLLAELIASDDLAEKWHEFASTILATENAIQSCPLGGYSGHSNDPMQSHRPGLADDGDIMGDDGMGPPAPPRGMLGGGDIIDMDDNDLDVAASMMASLNLRRPSPSEDDNSSGGSGSGDSFNSGGDAGNPTGYAFDDPLGKAGALGIELGKLTKYKGSDNDNDDYVDERGSSSDEENDSSSDEEPDRGDSSDDVPVMDLFAGNFDLNQDAQTYESQPEQQEWSADFANFDQADAEFGDFESAPAEALPVGQSEPELAAKSADEIFGTGDHVKVLEEADPLTDQKVLVEETTTEPGSDPATAHSETETTPTQESVEMKAGTTADSAESTEAVALEDKT